MMCFGIKSTALSALASISESEINVAGEGLCRGIQNTYWRNMLCPCVSIAAFLEMGRMTRVLTYTVLLVNVLNT